MARTSFDPTAAAATAVDARGVTVRYGAKTAVDGVDFSVGAGEIVAVIGPNGAGKTSLIECIEGLRAQSAGEISVAGLRPAHDRAQMAQLVGVQLQDSAYPARIRVDELCRLFASFYPDPLDPHELLEEFGLADKRKSQVTKLSGGQRQRLSLALALIGKPQIVFLDELTNGLDPQSRRRVWDSLRRRNDDGLTIVLTSHYMDEVEYLCDRVAVMLSGKLVAVDTVAGLIEAYADGKGRIVVENAAAREVMREELADLGAGVRLIPTGTRLQVDVTDPALQQSVEDVLAAHGAKRRQIGSSLEDVYIALTDANEVQ